MLFQKSIACHYEIDDAVSGGHSDSAVRICEHLFPCRAFLGPVYPLILRERKQLPFAGAPSVAAPASRGWAGETYWPTSANASPAIFSGASLDRWRPASSKHPYTAVARGRQGWAYRPSSG